MSNLILETGKDADTLKDSGGLTDRRSRMIAKTQGLGVTYPTAVLIKE